LAGRRDHAAVTRRSAAAPSLCAFLSFLEAFLNVGLAALLRVLHV
jgi:hypothetical protein